MLDKKKVYFLGHNKNSGKWTPQDQFIYNFFTDIQKVNGMQDADFVVVPSSEDQYEKDKTVQEASRLGKKIYTLKKMEKYLLYNFMKNTWKELSHFRNDWSTRIEKKHIEAAFKEYYQFNDEEDDGEIDEDDEDDEDAKTRRNLRDDWDVDDLTFPSEEKQRLIWAIRTAFYGAVKKPAHGDAYHILASGYRNHGLYFWDDQKKTFIHPYTGIDDYGSVPPRFRVGNGKYEFAPDHWVDVVDHNSTIFVSDEIHAKIRKREHLKVKDSRDSQDGERQCKIKIKGRIYHVTIHHENQVRSDFVCTSDDDIEQF